MLVLKLMLTTWDAIKRDVKGMGLALIAKIKAGLRIYIGNPLLLEFPVTVLVKLV